MTRSPRGDEGEQAGNDTRRPATQVGARRVEAGLGGHDDGAWGRRGGRKRIDPIIETVTVGKVGVEHVQFFQPFQKINMMVLTLKTFESGYGNEFIKRRS